jgi:hypothetical protein
LPTSQDTAPLVHDDRAGVPAENELRSALRRPLRVGLRSSMM